MLKITYSKKKAPRKTRKKEHLNNTLLILKPDQKYDKLRNIIVNTLKNLVNKPISNELEHKQGLL